MCVGRPPRDTGLESERSNQPSDTQALHLLNSTHIQRKILQSRPLRQAVKRSGQTSPLVRRLYLSILSRPPTSAELYIAGRYFTEAGAPKTEAAADLVWALINSNEFLYRH